jgi:serine/threonine-protein kinase
VSWAPIPDGTVLKDRFEIRRALGIGGFGATYLVTDRDRFDEEAALKELLPATAEHAATAARLFEREARTLKSLNLRGVPGLQAYFRLNGRYYLVQDFVRGENLLEISRRRGALPESVVRWVLEELLKILAHLHGGSPAIIHRDIKPANLMLTTAEDGNPDRLSLIDFGAVKEALGHNDLDVTRTRISTKWYAPPEQEAGAPVSAASDLYAAGVTALELLTGRPPWQMYDASGGCWRVDVPVTAAFMRVIEAMVQPDVTRRLQSAEETLAAVAAAGTAGIDQTSGRSTVDESSDQRDRTVQDTPIRQGEATRRSGDTVRSPGIERAAVAVLAGMRGLHGRYAIAGWLGAAAAALLLASAGLTSIAPGGIKEAPAAAEPQSDRGSDGAGRGGQPEAPPPSAHEPQPRSREYHTYAEDFGAALEIQVPDTWREVRGRRGVIFAPEGAYSTSRGNTTFSRGVELGIARIGSRDLSEATGRLIDAMRRSNPDLELRERPAPRRTNLEGREVLETALRNISDVSRAREAVVLSTSLLRGDRLFYAVAVAPESDYAAYAAALREVVRSIRFREDIGNRDTLDPDALDSSTTGVARRFPSFDHGIRR